MQGTVSRFDLDTHEGTVLLDDGVELPFSADAVAGSGLRFLRAGQRVRLVITGERGSLQVTGVQIITLT
jgi:cold shock CspA family protein